MRIAIIDGQGGGVGCALIERLRGKGHTLLALGTNSLATSAMLRAGADEGATGENAICYSVQRCDIIGAPIGMLAANALHGEVSPAIAIAVGGSDARKVFVPSTRCNIEIAGTQQMTLAQFADDAAMRMLAIAEGGK